jgi:hypothetical protein
MEHKPLQTLQTEDVTGQAMKAVAQPPVCPGLGYEGPDNHRNRQSG